MGLIDFDALLYGPNHTVFGETAEVTPPDALPIVMTAIDKTAGITVADARNVGVETIQPAAVIRMVELIAGGLAASDLPESTLTLNGKMWRVESYRLVPSPKGEAEGEVWLFLIEGDE